MADQYPDTIALVQYHPWDTYSTPWATSRASFYGATGTPMTVFDGVSEASGSYGNTTQDFNRYRAIYNTQVGIPTDVTIDLGMARVNPSTYTVTAEVCVESTGSSKTMRIYLVEVLDKWPAVNGYHRYGFRQAATTVDVTLSPGQCTTVQRTFTFDATSLANPDNIRMVAWAQAPLATGFAQVYQARSEPLIQDCNNNGISDPDEITADPSLDCQPDGNLDECQLDGNDCNANEIPDECDLLDNDCNANGTPDECELVGNDCNGNSLPDECDESDLAAATTPPTNAIVCPGEAAVFAVSAPASATAYQWYKDGVTALVDGGNISGAKTPTLYIDPAGSGDAGTYSCVVSIGCIAAESASATLALSGATLDITLVSAPIVTGCASSGVGIVAFEVAVDNPTGAIYQWSHEGVDLVDGGDIAGATSPRLEIMSPTGADVGVYTCRVNNGCLAEDVSTAGLLQLSAGFAVQPPPTVCAEYGSTVVFTAQLADPQPDMFYWYEGNIGLSDGGRYSGTHTDTLTMSNVQATDDGRTFRLLAVVNDPPCANFSANTMLVTAPVGGCPSCASPGDMDADGDFDLADMQRFTHCFGADVLATPTCACADIDAADFQVTIQDWLALEPLIAGPQ